MFSTFRRHTSTFRLMYIVQICHGFSYYGMFGLLTVYLVKGMNLAEAESFGVVGAYVALGYSLLTFGGFLADKVFGSKRCLYLGMAFKSIGYAAIGLSAWLQNEWIAYLALTTTSVGAGLANTGPGSLIGRSYEKGDKRVDGAFTLFYQGNNLGSFCARMLFPIIAASISWGFAFVCAGVAMGVGLVAMFLGRRSIEGVGSPADFDKVSSKLRLLMLAGSIAVVIIGAWLLNNILITQYLMGVIGIGACIYFLWEMGREHGVAKTRMGVALILLFESMLFFIVYNQMYTSMTFFSIHNVVPNVAGITINPISFPALNPLWIIIASPILANVYNKLGQKGKDPSIAVKFAIGMLFSCAAFLLLSLASNFADNTGLISSWWLVSAHGLQAIAELMVSALGLSVLAQLLPNRLTGFAIGAQAMTISAASIIGSKIAGFTATPKGDINPLETLPVYGHYFLYLAVAVGVVGLVMLFFAPKLTHMIENKPESQNISGKTARA
ncbi:Dipeptide and tripeptide permease A [invertebrate metagenome]|uniref:Dipeptide and tripeptide permease A n=1 Tax=invertebrate metagenome TaxID=1711999 RepID=A0A2H9T775_9ZZZZ